MEELYAAIEKKIKASGYPREISGADVYDDICDQIEGKENGSYILLSKFEDDVIFEYHITVMDADFNLGFLPCVRLREYLRLILMNKRTINNIKIPVSKGQKAVRACTIRLLNLGHAKYEKVAIYAVNQRISNIWRIAGAA